MGRLFTALLFSAGMLLGLPSGLRATQAPELVIVENDLSGPGVRTFAPLFFLDNPTFNPLGLTVVTGDDWRDDETDHLLRFLEIVHHPEIPVVQAPPRG